jgi:hypothetical protein
MNTIRVGEFTVQQRNMVVPDGGKVWLVGHPNRGILFASPNKREAIEWAKMHQ